MNAPVTFEFMPGEPLRCLPCFVPKPWGQEVWFTGSEKRGESCVENSLGQTLPLSLFLHAFGTDYFGKNFHLAETKLPLLKRLDTHNEPVFGDLYTEVHQEKNEVYICTSVSPNVWPSGVGKLRFGISHASLSNCRQDFATWKENFESVLLKYQAVRREVDGKIEEFAKKYLQKEISAVSLDELKSLKKKLPLELLSIEKELAEKSQSFVGEFPMVPGSVARVPQGVPHSLQAGVQVIEFQTPTYERLIVSFQQKVLTQQSWDVQAALSAISECESLKSPLVLLELENPVQRIVDFPDVVVDSVRLDAADDCARALGGGVIYCLPGVSLCRETTLLQGEAWLVPRKLNSHYTFVATGSAKSSRGLSRVLLSPLLSKGLKSDLT